jgi:hypothetical protein
MTDGESEGPKKDPFQDVRASWGFPAFARDFPRNDELDALVAAFARGDYRSVRERAPALAANAEDPAVKEAAQLLRARIEPDKTARLFFGLTAALLLFLSLWWVTHDGRTHTAPPEPPPKVEYVK